MTSHVPSRSRPANEPASPAKRGELLWATVWILGPYLLLAVLGIILAFGEATHCSSSVWCFTPMDRNLMIVMVTVPFAVLATGAAWVIVLLMNQYRLRTGWSAPARGAVAAACVWACMLGAAAVMWATGAPF